MTETTCSLMKGRPMFQARRVDVSVAEKRLQRLPNLAEALGANWLAREYQTPIDHWSLITGWISLKDNGCWHWLEDLDRALGLLKAQVSSDSWRKIVRKVRSHSDRSNSKGTLSEIATCVFLTNNSIRFELETRLVKDSKKDVDIRAFVYEGDPLHIEVQWLSSSDDSERGAAIASAYGEVYELDFDEEKWRIKGKIYDKTSKFTHDAITFVALNCTTSPVLGGSDRLSVIKEAVIEAYTGRNILGEEIPYADSDVDKDIRLYADCVIWYELDPGNGLLPIKRDFCLNPKSPHRKSISISRFVSLWNPSLERHRNKSALNTA